MEQNIAEMYKESHLSHICGGDPDVIDRVKGAIRKVASRMLPGNDDPPRAIPDSGVIVVASNPTVMRRFPNGEMREGRNLMVFIFPDEEPDSLSSWTDNGGRMHRMRHEPGRLIHEVRMNYQIAPLIHPELIIILDAATGEVISDGKYKSVDIGERVADAKKRSMEAQAENINKVVGGSILAPKSKGVSNGQNED